MTTGEIFSPQCGHIKHIAVGTVCLSSQTIYLLPLLKVTLKDCVKYKIRRLIISHSNEVTTEINNA